MPVSQNGLNLRRVSARHQSSKSNLERFFAAGVNRRDTDHTIIQELGFQIGLANSSERGPLTLRIHCGSYSERVSNSCVFGTSLGDGPPESLLTVPKCLQVLPSMIECFDVSRALVSCHELNEKIEFPLGAPHVGWVSFLSSEFRRMPDFKPPTRIVSVEGKGNIIVLTDERFDSERPDHLAIAKDVVAALRRAKVIPKP